ncbi:MAG: stress-induced protein [Hyphomicrobiales bacterium]|nr:MAG: stress-induced protein [Hyphomicrobiales bacterium]
MTVKRPGFSRPEAASLRRKGGQSVDPTKRSFAKNHALASEVGRKGGHASHGSHRA